MPRPRLLPSLRQLHWPHLFLLVLLPGWWWWQLHSDWAPGLSLLSWLVLVGVVAAVSEWLWPFRADWTPTVPELKRDGSLFGLNAIADGLADVLIAAVVISLSGTAQWPLALQIISGVLVAEFGSWLLHRISHGPGWLWSIHVLHHLPGSVNASNSFAAHPLNALYNKLARNAPLVLLGLSAEALLFISLFGLLQNLIVHANIRGELGFLNYLIGTAELHRLHHSNRPEDAGNYGTSVPFWDLLSGSFRWGEAPCKVGVYNPERYPDAVDLKGLLILPLGGRRRQSAASTQR